MKITMPISTCDFNQFALGRMPSVPLKEKNNCANLSYKAVYTCIMRWDVVLLITTYHSTLESEYFLLIVTVKFVSMVCKTFKKTY